MRRRRFVLRLAVLVCAAAMVYFAKPLFFDVANKRSPSDVSRAVQTNSTPIIVTEQHMITEMRLVTGHNNTKVETCGLTVPSIQEKCSQIKYDSLGSLPKTSVIITFHDSETVASLVRTIHSVVQRTPDELLQEIIVIDDFSQKDDLGQLLEIYFQKVFSKKVKLIRNSENLGLIKSRLKGSRLSTGDVLFFMDSHSEVLPGWLEPLLFEIKKNRRTLVTSLIDWIMKDENKWTYRQGCADVTVIWDYTFGFGWDFLPKEEERTRNDTDAVKLKSIIGTSWAIDKQFFQEIGELDEGMEFWGGENIELPIRTWLFDGQVITVPCSRVAHLEGKTTRSYRNEFTKIIRRNYKRLAEVWFDDYKDCFYYYFPDLVTVDAGNLTDRLRIKAAAHHDFKWYLQNIFRTMGCAVQDSFAYGPLTNLETGQCLNIDDGSNLQTSACSEESHGLKAYWSQLFHLREPNYIWLVAIETGSVEQKLYKQSYVLEHLNENATKWIHWTDGPMMELETRLCLEASSTESVVKLRPCNFSLYRNQTWRFAHYTEKYNDLINRQKTNSYGNIRDILLQSMNNYSSPGTQSPRL